MLLCVIRVKLTVDFKNAGCSEFHQVIFEKYFFIYLNINLFESISIFPVGGLVMNGYIIQIYRIYALRQRYKI